MENGSDIDEALEESSQPVVVTKTKWIRDRWSSDHGKTWNVPIKRKKNYVHQL